MSLGGSVTCERRREAGGAGEILARDGTLAQPLLLPLLLLLLLLPLLLLLLLLMPLPANS